MKRPGKIVQWKNSEGQIKNGIIYNEDQRKTKGGFLFVTVTDSDINPITIIKNGKEIAIVSLKKPEDLAVIGFVD